MGREGLGAARAKYASMGDHWLDYTFAYAPWVIGIAIVLVAYVAMRANAGGAPIGQTFVCARCGKRRYREHMVPATHEGAVGWYCSGCA